MRGARCHTRRCGASDARSERRLAYTLRYHPRVSDDLKAITAQAKTRIARAIESRLTSAPEHYGVPLTGTLKGYRKLRVGDYRVVFRLDRSEVTVLAIVHRSDVYQRTTPSSTVDPARFERKAFYSPTELANLIGVDPSTVLDWIHREELYALRLGPKTYRIPLAVVMTRLDPGSATPRRVAIEPSEIAADERRRKRRSAVAR